MTVQADCVQYIDVGSDQNRPYFYPVSQHDFNDGGLANNYCWVTA